MPGGSAGQPSSRAGASGTQGEGPSKYEFEGPSGGDPPGRWQNQPLGGSSGAESGATEVAPCPLRDALPPKRPGPPRVVSVSPAEAGCGVSHGCGSSCHRGDRSSHVRCRLLRRSGSVVTTRCGLPGRRSDLTLPLAGFVLTEVTATPTVVQLPARRTAPGTAPVDRPRPPANRLSWPLRRWRLGDPGEPGAPAAMRSGQRARRSSAASPADLSARRLRGPRPSEPGRGGRPLSG